jgi:GMP reductase
MININKTYYDFKDVLIKSKFSTVESRSAVNLTMSFKDNSLFENWHPIPIMSANMDTVTDVEMAFELLKRNWIPVLHKYVSIDDINKLFNAIDLYNESATNKIDYRNLFISRGTSDTDKQKLKERLEAEPRIKSVCIDVANGHRESIIDYIKELKSGLCKDKILMVGNIGSSDMIIHYSLAGVDIAKCGIGPGSACETRIKTGVGTPQISLIDEVANEIKRLNLSGKIFLVSDGGCKNEGDIAKAFAAGSDFVMIGGMLSGYKESPGTIEVVNDRKFKRFSGMAAKESQRNGVPQHGTEEGKTVMIPYKGKVYHKLNDIEGGLRSACTYTDSKSIQELRNAELILSTVQENKVFS